MSLYHDLVAEALRRSVYAVTGSPLHGEGARMTAKIFETLLEEWHGLEIVTHSSLIVEGDMFGDIKVVKIDEGGKIHLPEDLKLPLSPKRAHQLGVALIGGAHLSREQKREHE